MEDVLKFFTWSKGQKYMHMIGHDHETLEFVACGMKVMEVFRNCGGDLWLGEDLRARTGVEPFFNGFAKTLEVLTLRLSRAGFRVFCEPCVPFLAVLGKLLCRQAVGETVGDEICASILLPVGQIARVYF